ncbi:hypothetical protein MTO96_036082, partial [Rhipicephalus appendiculatus]
MSSNPPPSQTTSSDEPTPSRPHRQAACELDSLGAEPAQDKTQPLSGPESAAPPRSAPRERLHDIILHEPSAPQAPQERAVLGVLRCLFWPHEEVPGRLQFFSSRRSRIERLATTLGATRRRNLDGELPAGLATGSTPEQRRCNGNATKVGDGGRRITAANGSQRSSPLVEAVERRSGHRHEAVYRRVSS